MTTQKLKQLYDYDDIERYTYCRYKGRPGWIMDKGDHISETTGNHIYIEFQDGGAQSTLNLRQNLVDRYLRNRNNLWVDFTHNIHGYDD